MKRATLLGMALCAMSWLAIAATAKPAKKKVVKRRTHAVSAPSKTAPKTSARAKSATAKSRTAPSKGAKARKTVARSTRSRQMAPSKDRYQQIQQALAGKGYFTGEANGQWGPDSVDALKRFQADQNLTPDGKLTSLSLIALGLGPKRLSAQSTAQSAHGDLQQ